MSMDYEKIHSCSNDCILYRKEYEHLEKYPLWEGHGSKQMTNLRLRYYGIFDNTRFKRMFKNAEHAKSLMWH